MIRIGIIAEGRPDQAVLKNILLAFKKDFEVLPLRPDLTKDATDRSLEKSAAIKNQNDKAAGGLARVKADCEEGSLLEDFFVIGTEQDKIIIQIDTAEIENYKVIRPSKKLPSYSQKLRDNTIAQIKKWLEANPHLQDILFAISIEELEAWILPLYESKNSTASMKPKEKLKKLLTKKNISTEESYPNYEKISKDFKKIKKLKTACRYNESLALFCQDLEKFIQTLP